MKYNQISLEEFLGNLKSQIKPTEKEIKNFRVGISKIESEIGKIEAKKSNETNEEYEKNIINQLLKDTYQYDINTKGKIDAAIYEDEQAQVIFEVKALKNKAEFPKTKDCLQSKALCESILYYLREFNTHNNNNIKHIILCNLRDFYIIDAKDFHECFAKDREINKFFKNVDKNQGNDTSTKKFYEEVEGYLPTLDKEISYAYFELSSTSSDIALIYSLLSPTFLLKRRSYVDANTLNQAFYDELLYILGLQEKSENGKIIIVPNEAKNSFLNSISQRLGLDKNEDFEQIFSLLTTWNNRILFLRLLESMLLSFGHIKKPFLDTEAIKDFEMLSILFFDVLAKKEEKRDSDIPSKFKDIPYLNSSLFDKTILEKDSKEGGQNKQIRLLLSNPLDIYSKSILKKSPDYKDKSSLPLLEYLFAFLNSYDFTTTPEDIINHTKTNSDKLINSAVLGLVFEKLNGYKEGSFYTPSFITSYMCRQSLEKIVLDKFNASGFVATDLDELYNKIEDIKVANEIFDSIRICDPAVGSGHYLVSALNELIILKHRLGILVYDDKENKKIKDIRLELKNDEIVIYDSENKIHSYHIPSHENIESHKIQKAIFNTKRNIIENCLFGVDVNPNSCEITRLRLWIELLKYSYYKDIPNRRLETLPNIDINIKAGNSIISNIDLKTNQDSLKKRLFDLYDDRVNLDNIEELKKIGQDLTNKLPDNIDKYKKAVCDYKNVTDKDLKDEDKKKIEESKKFILGLFNKLSHQYIDFRLALEKYLQGYGYAGIDEASINGKEVNKDIKDKLNGYSIDWNLHKQDYNADKNTVINTKDLTNLIDLMNVYEKFKDAPTFEWRFEFPEVLDENGDFIGFDLLIGNPPYIRQELLKDIKPHLSKHFSVYSGTSDIYTYFFEQGYKVLRDRGRLSFITSNKWTRAGYGRSLRSFILEKTSLETYVEFNGVKVFDSATVDTSIVEFIKQTSKNHDFKYISITTKPKNGTDIANTASQMINTSTLSAEAFTFGDSATIALKQKIESIGTPLKDWDISINYGIKTGYNEAFIIDTTKRDEILSKCDDSEDSHLPFELIDGHYIRCKDKKDAILLTEKERTAHIIRPILRGKDIKRYSYEWADKWVIVAKFDSHKYLEKDYPQIYNHLLLHKDKLQARGQCKYARGKESTNKGYPGQHHWLELDNNPKDSYMNEFARQKIVWAEMTKESCFTYDEDGYLTNQTCYFIPNASKYLLGILNSKIIYFYMKEISSTLGENSLRWIKQFIEKLPIPKVDEGKEVAFVDIVNEIIECKKENKPTKELEEKLDLMVFELYNLNETEIKSVLSLSLSLLIAALLISALQSEAKTLVRLILENFESEIKEAFRYQEGLKIPTIEYEGKILYPCIMTKEPSFVYDDSGFYAPAPANIITGKETDIKYLIALLNSKLIYFAMRSFYMGGGIDGELKTNNLLKIPIPKIESKNQNIVNKIIDTVNKRIKQITTSSALELDSQINQLVYELYELSDEEIAFMHSL